MLILRNLTYRDTDLPTWDVHFAWDKNFEAKSKIVARYSDFPKSEIEETFSENRKIGETFFQKPGNRGNFFPKTGKSGKHFFRNRKIGKYFFRNRKIGQTFLQKYGKSRKVFSKIENAWDCVRNQVFQKLRETMWKCVSLTLNAWELAGLLGGGWNFLTGGRWTQDLLRAKMFNNEAKLL